MISAHGVPGPKAYGWAVSGANGVQRRVIEVTCAFSISYLNIYGQIHNGGEIDQYTHLVLGTGDVS